MEDDEKYSILVKNRKTENIFYAAKKGTLRKIKLDDKFVDFSDEDWDNFYEEKYEKRLVGTIEFQNGHISELYLNRTPAEHIPGGYIRCEPYYFSYRNPGDKEEVGTANLDAETLSYFSRDLMWLDTWNFQRQK